MRSLMSGLTVVVSAASLSPAVISAYSVPHRPVVCSGAGDPMDLDGMQRAGSVMDVDGARAVLDCEISDDSSPETTIRVHGYDGSSLQSMSAELSVIYCNGRGGVFLKPVASGDSFVGEHILDSSTAELESTHSTDFKFIRIHVPVPDGSRRSYLHGLYYHAV